MNVARFDPLGPAVSPVALAVIVGLAWLYLRGASRPRLVREHVGQLRHGLFVLGLGLLLMSFAGPLAGAGQRLFAAHQIQHLMIRLLGPMLIVLAHPVPVLRAGLPRGMRQRFGRLGRRGAWRAVARGLTRLDVSLALLISSLYVWQLPALHAAALVLPPLALGAHGVMVLAGLNFFAVVFGRQGPPDGAPHSLRLVALVGIILSNILLGSLTTLKGTVLYSGYDIAGRLWDFAPLADETVGGYTIWVPSSFVIVAAIILVFNGWNALEVRQWNARHDWSGSNAAALEYPETAQELRLKVSDRNLRLVRTLALIAATMFVGAIVTVTTLVYAF